MKKLFKRSLIAILFLIPCSGVAFFDIGGSTILPQILGELVYQTKLFLGSIDELQLINTMTQEMRTGIDDPLSLDVPGLLDREEQLRELYNTSEEAKQLTENILSLSQNPSYGQLKQTVKDVWGHLPRSHANKLEVRDEQAIYSLGQASLIAEEAKNFAATGENLLEDLNGAAESKATIRSAQAQALQVQQLAQIEANQGLLLSLEAQQTLSANQMAKGITAASDSFYDMLEHAFSKVSEGR